jgi:hypothetical protein
MALCGTLVYAGGVVQQGHILTGMAMIALATIGLGGMFARLENNAVSQPDQFIKGNMGLKVSDFGAMAATAEYQDLPIYIGPGSHYQAANDVVVARINGERAMLLSGDTYAQNTTRETNPRST